MITQLIGRVSTLALVMTALTAGYAHVPWRGVNADRSAGAGRSVIKPSTETDQLQGAVGCCNDSNDRSILQNCEHRSAMSDLSMSSRSRAG